MLFRRPISISSIHSTVPTPLRHLRFVALLECVALVASGRLEAYGQTNAADQFVVAPDCRVTYAQSIQLASERRGIVAGILKPGAEAAAGGDVVQLKDSLVRATMAIAEREAGNDVELRFAQKAAELSQLKYDRAMAADAKITGTVSELEMKELRLAAERAALQCEQAEHRLAVARLRRDEAKATLDSYHIVAPFKATVRATFKQPGEVVQEGEVVAEIVNPERIRIEGDVPLQDLPALALHAEVIVRINSSPGSTTATARDYLARLEFVDVKVEPVSQKVHVAAELDNRDGLLRDGLTATMFIRRAASESRKTANP
jgi:membrane fusion protein, multidrug efflux system